MAELSENKEWPSKSWFCVFNNPDEHGYDGDPKEICERLRDEWIDAHPAGSGWWGYCISAAGLHHIHMVVEDVKKMRFSEIKKTYAPGAHFEKTQGTKKEVEAYINKTGKYEEKGEQVIYSCQVGELKGKQGRRTDLLHMYDMIRDGFTDYEIIEDNPDYIKHLSKIRDTRQVYISEQCKKMHKREMHCEFWQAPPGVDLSGMIYDKFGFRNVYTISDYSYIWDGYEGQDVVLFDDIDMDRIRHKDLKRWLNIYPIDLHCRFQNKPARFTKVFMTSHESFENLFKWVRINYFDDYMDLKRLVHVCLTFDKNGVSGSSDGFFRPSDAEIKQIQEEFGG